MVTLIDDNLTIHWQVAAVLRAISVSQVAGMLHTFIEQPDDMAARAEAEKLLQLLASNE